MDGKAIKQASVKVSPISGVAPPKERQFGQPERRKRIVKESRGGKMKNGLTRNGVAKDLSLSPYTFTEFNNGKEYTFYFSSQLHLNKFNKLRQKNFVMIYNYIYKRFKFKVDCQTLADFNLYKKIENRGCYIKIGNKYYRKIDNISLN